MPSLFVVIRTRGPAWNPDQPLEGQRDWSGHAAFMDALAAEGFVLLGGPLEGTPDVLLIVRAGSEDEIVVRLSADPWTSLDLLRTRDVTLWTLRAGAVVLPDP